tara:strand:+ start:495 stop:752 length:258 start_codon:yes stop_codon:yes gene_type:complete
MEKSTSENKTPHIKVLSVEPDEEGKSELTFEVNDEFIDMIKKEKNVSTISVEDLNHYVHELVMKCANNTDGYSYETIKTSEETDD